MRADLSESFWAAIEGKNMRSACCYSAIVLLTVGCSTTSSESEDTAPVADMSRGEVITWARGIDPCALLDRSALQSVGTVTAVGTSGQSTGCEAILGPEDATTAVSWSVAFVPKDFHTTPMGNLETIDGKEVRKIDVASTLSPEQAAQLVESACSYDIPFENSIAVRMRVSAPRGGDGCAAGLPLVRNVLKNWPAQPKQGSSSDTTVTRLTAAQPCAAIPDLQQSHSVVFDWADQSLVSCFFTIDGVETLVSFDYQEKESVTFEAEPVKFGNFAGYTKTDGGSTTNAAIVGDQFSGVKAGRQSELVPAVEVFGDSSPVLTVVTTAVLDKL